MRSSWVLAAMLVLSIDALEDAAFDAAIGAVDLDRAGREVTGAAGQATFGRPARKIHKVGKTIK